MNEENITKRTTNKKIKKWIKIVLFVAIIVFLLSFLLNKNFWDSALMLIKRKVYLNNIEKQEEAYSQDIYGGKTPEETYQLFLEALKKKDIELASKYFVLDKQEQYKKALHEVDQNGMWDLMMEDLTRLDSANWDQIAEDYVNLELFSEDNISVEQITFILPSAVLPPNEIISNVWKILSF